MKAVCFLDCLGDLVTLQSIFPNKLETSEKLAVKIIDSIYAAATDCKCAPYMTPVLSL